MTSTNPNPRKAFDHVVLFQAPEDAEALVAGLEAFLSASPVERWRVVEDLGLRAPGPHVFSVMAVIGFDDIGSFEEYLASEGHQRFIREVIEPGGFSLASLQVAAGSFVW